MAEVPQSPASAQPPRLGAMSPAERAAEFARADVALRDGGLVVVGSDSGSLAVARADTFAGLEALRAIFRTPAGRTGFEPLPPALLSRGVNEFLSSLGPEALSRVHARLISRLAPGPAVFLIELDPARLDALRTRLRIGPEAVDRASMLSVRIPGPSAAATLAQRATGALACVELLDRSGESVTDPVAAAESVRGAGLEVSAVLDDGVSSSRRRATVVRLRSDSPEPEIVRAGAYEERFIRKQTGLRVLFVCTGNTCRSPMAEAIGRSLAAKLGPGLDLRFESAGLSAGTGGPMTPEAAAALSEIGVPSGRHHSRALQSAQVQDADVIYAMTRSHRDAIASQFPDAAAKVVLLDPAGNDVHDPIGASAKVYTDTAKVLADLIARRLKELT